MTHQTKFSKIFPATQNLIAVMMRVPNSKGIHAPSQICEPISIPDLSEYQHTAKTMLVSFDLDGISNPQETVTYLIDTEIRGECGSIERWPMRYCHYHVVGFCVKNWPMRAKAGVSNENS